MRSASPPRADIMKSWPYSRSQLAGRFGFVSMAAMSQRMAACGPSGKTRQAIFFDGDWKPMLSLWACEGPVAITSNAKGASRYRMYTGRTLRSAMPVVTGAHQFSRHRAGMLAAFENRNARRDRRLIAVHTLDKTPAVGRHVVHQLRLVQLQPLEVDQGYAG